MKLFPRIQDNVLCPRLKDNKLFIRVEERNEDDKEDSNDVPPRGFR